MKTFWRIVQYLRDYRLRLVAACICSACVAGLTATYAWLVRPVLDGIFIDKDQFLLLILAYCRVDSGCLKGPVFLWAGLSYELYWQLGRRRCSANNSSYNCLRLPVRFHDTNATGRLVARVMSDVNQMAKCHFPACSRIFSNRG